MAELQAYCAVVIAIAIKCKKRRKKVRKHKFWVKDWLKRRKSLGA